MVQIQESSNIDCTTGNRPLAYGAGTVFLGTFLSVQDVVDFKGVEFKNDLNYTHQAND